ncbi:hypothetical protein [Paenarthrobacter ureafaciens]|uniref:hypothetical protein n=1 Tax=Paenarthrobacter ureafaciens TaxID=37931 RepID=UPI001FB24839|nr:hypothetical protein [Paenarthrobacter ureafaciens]UOD80351.1 hypothetical protein MQZ73_14680 [Paenarthrobacter ureafaciens]WNZ03004.1 hypothetical protein PVT25_15320 [Paenarthrobacter ureafaciens]
MADINALVAQVTALEGEITGTTNYDGNVPTKVPEAGGYILPYFVNWFGTGDSPDEVTSDGQQPTDSLIWDFQITAVASNAAACRSVAQALKQKLRNRRIGKGTLRLNPDGFQQQAPILDTTITPARFMLPIPWRLITD